MFHRTEKHGFSESSGAIDQGNRHIAPEPLGNEMGLIHIKLFSAGVIPKILKTNPHLGIQIGIAA